MEDPSRKFGRMTVPQLKAFLTERGIPCHEKSLAVKAAETHRVIEPRAPQLRNPDATWPPSYPIVHLKWGLIAAYGYFLRIGDSENWDC